MMMKNSIRFQALRKISRSNKGWYLHIILGYTDVVIT